MQNKKAEAGIGTLILFIALILVAAVAAAVLISTASSLQSKALFTGSKAQGQVSTQGTIIYAYAKDGSTADHQINLTFVKIKLAPGSEPIKLSEALLEVDTRDLKNSLTFNADVDCSLEDDTADGLFNETVRGIYYGMTVLAGNSDEYMERGEVLELCFALPANVGEGEDLRLAFSPKIGSPSIVETKTPDTMLTERIQLFP